MFIGAACGKEPRGAASGPASNLWGRHQ